MSLLPMNQGIYGQPTDASVQLQDISQQRKLAEQLRQQGAQEVQGQMVSGRYVAPSWSQQLAKVLQSGVGSYLEGQARNKEKDYNTEKARKFGEILSGNKPQQIEGAPNVTTGMPAYTPEQQDQFGSPLPNVQRTPVTTSTPTMTQETPEALQARQQQAVLQYMQQYGATPEGQVLLADMNHQRDRGERKEDILDQRTYEGTTHARDRSEHVEDIKGNQEFQRIQAKEAQGFQLSRDEQNFKQQVQLQKLSQNFTAGQNTLSRNAAANNEAPIAVIGADGQPQYVRRSDAIGQKPYSAANEAKDVLKTQQKAQSEISTQQVLDQALALHQHPGRNMATGLTSFTSAFPGTDARGFKANLDTFKAQTFIPMVSALKGMGALSDAEGKKLSDSVGALDPGMSSKEFDASLQKITKTLYDKAKVSGLNVSMPDFGSQAQPDTTQAGGLPSQDALAAEMKRRGL